MTPSNDTVPPQSPAPQSLALVEDDDDLRLLTLAMLADAGYAVTGLSDGQALDAHLAAHPAPDLVILDLMLPGEDGLSICRKLAARGESRIMMLTARGSENDRILGLETGADDYLTKPFNPRELLARIRAVLRRPLGPPPVTAGSEKPATASAPLSPAAATPATAPPPTEADMAKPADLASADRLEFLDWRLDMTARALTHLPSGRDVVLSSGEFNLLAVFVRAPGRVLSRDHLLDVTRGRVAGPFDRAIDVQVSKLRRKLGDEAEAPRILKTVRGGGYVFAAPLRLPA